MKLLVLRPQPGADATAARVKAAGHEPLIMPLFEVAPVAWNARPPRDYDNLLLTSANAVRLAGANLALYRDLPVLAVGTNTAHAARAAELSVAQTGRSGVSGLLQGVKGVRLLWLTGEDHIEMEADSLIGIDKQIVYRSAAIRLRSDFDKLVRGADHILLHSPRAARHFSELLTERNMPKAAISIAALSPNIAQAAGDGWKSVRVAPEPSDGALLSQI
jgi:uroporphyrinogen-III synthase